MTFENIQFDVAAGVARLTLNRPDKLNSFTGAMHAEIRTVLDRIQADKSVRVLVMRSDRAIAASAEATLTMKLIGPKRSSM